MLSSDPDASQLGENQKCAVRGSRICNLLAAVEMMEGIRALELAA